MKLLIIIFKFQFIEYLFVGYIAGFLVLNVIFEFIAMICCENYFKPYNDNDRVIF